MSDFYATIQGARGQAHRGGTKNSGMESYTASWSGAVRCKAYKHNGQDMVRVELVPWRGEGTNRLLYLGRMDGKV